MTRKTTKNIEKKISEAIASDERMATRLSAASSFLDAFERSLNDHADTLKREIDLFRDHMTGELNVMRPMLVSAVAELRGEDEPQMGEHKEERKEEQSDDKQGSEPASGVVKLRKGGVGANS